MKGDLGGCFALLCVALLVTLPAFSQSPPSPEVEEPEMLVGIDVGYNTAFRMKHWTSTDVFIVNEEADRSGWVEVRMYGPNNQLQSPTYRMRGDFPQGSRKRFRFNCYYDTTQRVEAWVYDERGRALIDVPAYIQLQPIEHGDLLIAVLDDDPTRYGFLYNAIQTPDNPLKRIHRFSLSSADFALLPNRVEAYKAFDGIIIGAIEPTRMPVEQRELLRRYVQHGGTIILCTGIQGPQYRGTWLEELAGVTIGEAVETTDGMIATAAFESEELRRGTRADRPSVIAELQRGPGVSVLGSGVSLATARSFGRGRVYTLAVDVASGALMDTEGYRRFWAESLQRDPYAEDPLNFEGVTQACAQQLPHLAGVSIRSRSFVMGYLGLYIGVGVILNWLFWNHFKRREYAWLTLLVFSMGFTGYAFFDGSAGSGQWSQAHQVEVIYIHPGGGPADHHIASGIITSRTTSYEGPVTMPGALVYDGSLLFANADRQQTRTFGLPQLIRPFEVHTGDETRIENFRVGASELRLAQIQASGDAYPAIESSLVHDGNGIGGEVSTGPELALENAAMFYRGALLPMQKTTSGSWTLMVPPDRLNNARANLQNDLNQWAMQHRDLYLSLRYAVLLSLFTGANYGYIDPMTKASSDFPPVIVGWLSESGELAFQPEASIETGTAFRLLIAGVDVAYPDRERREQLVLPVGYSFTNRWYADGNVASRPDYAQTQIYTPTQADLFIRPLQDWMNDPTSKLHLRVIWYNPDDSRELDDRDLVLSLPGADNRDWHDEHLAAESTVKLDQADAAEYEYVVEDWRDALDQGGNLNFKFVDLDNLQRRYPVAVIASGEFRIGYEPPEGTLPWR